MGHVETLWKGTLGGFAALRNRATLLRLPGVPNLMSSFARSSLVAALLLISLQLMFSDDTKAPAINPELAAADQLLSSGQIRGSRGQLSDATQGRCEAGACARWACAGNVAATER